MNLNFQYYYSNSCGISRAGRQRMHKQEEFEGTGVGLSIAQCVIERHEERIWAEAAPGKGARFYFALKAHRT